MGFKDKASFLKFITMGAAGTSTAIRELDSQYRHSIIELERYSSSNKIWNTKIKRFRLPDLLCVNCGLRFEVKTKSNLQIKMSHSETNVERAWNAGLRQEDIIVFLANIGLSDSIQISPILNCFNVNSLNSTVDQAILGPPKSGAEGSERDLTWATWTAPNNGNVVEVNENQIKVQYDQGRKYTYTLRGKASYVRAGDTFQGNKEMLAGLPSAKYTTQCRGRVWEPDLLDTTISTIDLYAAIKCLAHRNDHGQINNLIIFTAHEDIRLRLEAMGALARLGNNIGIELLRNYATNALSPTEYVMESVFILTEVNTPAAIIALEYIFDNSNHIEVKSACIWNLCTKMSSISKALSNLHLRNNEVAQHIVAGLSLAISGSEDTILLLNALNTHSNIASILEIVVRAKNICLNSVLIKTNSLTDESLKMNLIQALSLHSIDKLEICPEFLLLSDEVKGFLRGASVYRATNWVIDGNFSEDLDFLLFQTI